MNLLAVAPLVLLPVMGTTPGTEPPNDPELEQLLLTVDDLPTGWAEDASGTFSGGVTDPPTECEAQAFPELGDVSEFPTATVAFVTGGGLLDFNIVVEGIIDVGDSEAATGFVEGISLAMTECPSDEGETFGEMSFPELGDASTAMLVTSPEDEGFTLSAALIVIAVDELVLYLFGVGEGADGELLDDIANTAVEKLE